MAMLIVFIGLAITLLGGIGILIGKAPLIKLKGRLAYGGLLFGGLVVIILGGSLLPDLPKSDVILTFTPATAQVKLDGQTYTQSPIKVKVTDLSYTVKASAKGYHTQSVEWNTKKQKSLHIDLKKITAAERAAQRAEKARKAKEAADAEVAAQAAAEARAAQAARADQELDDGTFIVKCQDVVRSRLKSPSTAKFPGIMEKAAAVITYENSNKDWSGWVDSQNSFGTMLRTEFLCEYDLDGQKLEITLKN